MQLRVRDRDKEDAYPFGGWKPKATQLAAEACPLFVRTPLTVGTSGRRTVRPAPWEHLALEQVRAQLKCRCMRRN